MKLNPKYSYEFNCVLNSNYDESEQIKNFTSLITDKDRFLILLPLLNHNRELIEKGLGYTLPENLDFFIVRGELFKSFSEPITVEYSILPEEMFLFLFKEILKVTITDRFLSEELREQYINSFIDYVCVNGEFGKNDFVKFTKNLHDESKRLFPNYEFKEYDFSNKTMLDYISEMYEN